MKSNHARMISSALVVLAGSVLVSAPRSENANAGALFVLIGGIALVIEWFASFFPSGFWNEKYVVPFPETCPEAIQKNSNDANSHLPQ